MFSDPLGSSVASTNTNMLSWGAISMLEKLIPGWPSTLILNTEEFPPAREIFPIFTNWLWGFMILNDSVTVPMVVNTVSKKTVSTVK